MLRTAALAFLGKGAPVQDGQSIARQARSLVQAVHILRDAKVKDARVDQPRNGTVGERRLGRRKVHGRCGTAAGGSAVIIRGCCCFTVLRRLVQTRSLSLAVLLILLFLLQRPNTCE